MQVTVTLSVVYDPDTVPGNVSEDLLRSIEGAIQRGLLSPTGEEVVDEYSLSEVETNTEECQGCRNFVSNYMIVSHATTDGSHLDLCMKCGPATLADTPGSKIVQNITIESCRELRESGRAFELGDRCWIDPLGVYPKDNTWADKEWIMSRGPEWIVRSVDELGVYASYKLDHAPTFFGKRDLVAYVRTDVAKVKTELTTNIQD
jgi:hypothetical protein